MLYLLVLTFALYFRPGLLLLNLLALLLVFVLAVLLIILLLYTLLDLAR
jgi:hypothetical protein